MEIQYIIEALHNGFQDGMRRTGRTENLVRRAIKYVMENDGGCAVIAASDKKQAETIKRMLHMEVTAAKKVTGAGASQNWTNFDNYKIVTLGSCYEHIKGLRGKAFIDHHATEEALWMAIHQINQMRAEIAKLRDKLNEDLSRPMTNREWLMSLSDEELANEYSNLVAHVFCSCCDYVKKESCHDAPEGACFEARVQWLKAEHREVSE